MNAFMKQDEALNVLKMGKNVFLTGAAGAGKTYLLNQYIQYLKENNVRIAVTASTGIAATHLRGTTIHSWSGIGVKDHLTPADLEKLLTNKRIARNYKKTKVLIIDELSMLHKNQLDMVDRIARHMLQSEQAFGGMQIVLCGDFFQLPPVSAGPSIEDTPFAFESAVWTTGDFHICYLDEQHRQSNDPLLDVLNDIRRGTVGEHTKIPLRTRYKKEPQGETKATKLYSRNINVDVINAQELGNIQGQTNTFTMKTEGFSTLVEGLKKSCLALEKLALKIGAQVMFIKNEVTGKYVNGTRGVVVGFEKSKDGWPIVKTFDSQIIIVSPETWQFEDHGVVRATLTQVPLRLAWAITIHKSQGMTLDAAEIDLGDAFEPGMGYVALSRVRSLNGLKLMNLNEMALTVHPKVLHYDETMKQHSMAIVEYVQSLSEEEKTTQHTHTLTVRFAGSKVSGTSKNPKPPKKNTDPPTHLITLELLKKNLSIEAIAEQRGFTDSTIMNHIEKLWGLKLIEETTLAQLRNTIPAQDFELILAEFTTSEDGKLTPIYNKFEGKYSYRWIQLVRLFHAVSCSRISTAYI
jgi:ATP-dependent DNA helicase PIF1